MHESSYENMREFVEKYLNKNKPLNILDIGSQAVPGQAGSSYRPLFAGPQGWRYTGADMVAGENVDIVLKTPYDWKGIPSRAFDCVVSGQVLEHDEFFWLTFMEIKRVLKVGGLCCLIAPSSGNEHKFPVDCYRFYPDGLRAAAKYAGLQVRDCFAQWNSALYPGMDPVWRDCVLIAQRPALSPWGELKFFVKARGLKLLSRNAAHSLDGLGPEQYGAPTTYQDPAFCRSSTPRLYYEDGGGLCEEHSLPGGKLFSGQPYSQRFPLPAGCTLARFDPVEGRGCVVKGLSARTDKGPLPASHNGAQVQGREAVLFETNDPQLLFQLPQGARWLELACTIHLLE